MSDGLCFCCDDVPPPESTSEFSRGEDAAHGFRSLRTFEVAGRYFPPGWTGVVPMVSGWPFNTQQDAEVVGANQQALARHYQGDSVKLRTGLGASTNYIINDMAVASGIGFDGRLYTTSVPPSAPWESGGGGGTNTYDSVGRWQGRNSFVIGEVVFVCVKSADESDEDWSIRPYECFAAVNNAGNPVTDAVHFREALYSPAGRSDQAITTADHTVASAVEATAAAGLGLVIYPFNDFQPYDRVVAGDGQIYARGLFTGVLRDSRLDPQVDGRWEFAGTGVPIAQFLPAAPVQPGSAILGHFVPVGTITPGQIIFTGQGSRVCVRAVAPVNTNGLSSGQDFAPFQTDRVIFREPDETLDCPGTVVPPRYLNFESTSQADSKMGAGQYAEDRATEVVALADYTPMDGAYPAPTAPAINVIATYRLFAERFADGVFRLSVGYPGEFGDGYNGIVYAGEVRPLQTYHAGDTIEIVLDTYYRAGFNGQVNVPARVTTQTSHYVCVAKAVRFEMTISPVPGVRILTSPGFSVTLGPAASNAATAFLAVAPGQITFAGLASRCRLAYPLIPVITQASNSNPYRCVLRAVRMTGYTIAGTTGTATWKVLIVKGTVIARRAGAVIAWYDEELEEIELTQTWQIAGANGMGATLGAWQTSLLTGAERAHWRRRLQGGRWQPDPFEERRAARGTIAAPLTGCQRLIICGDFENGTCETVEGGFALAAGTPGEEMGISFPCACV